jgi:hypothetical protein
VLASSGGVPTDHVQLLVEERQYKSQIDTKINSMLQKVIICDSYFFLDLFIDINFESLLLLLFVILVFSLDFIILYYIDVNFERLID